LFRQKLAFKKRQKKNTFVCKINFLI
jgi:hypothetical protein